MTELQTCDNCGRAIGRLEQAEFWKQYVVCSECKVKLARQATGGAEPAPPAPAAAQVVPTDVDEDELDWEAPPAAQSRWSPPIASTGGGFPKEAKLAIAGTVAGVAILVGTLHFLSSKPEESATAVVPAKERAKPSGFAPVIPSNLAEVGKTDPKITEQLLAASDFESGGKSAEALSAYQGVVDSLSGRGTLDESQGKLLARAKQAVTRLSAVQPSPPKRGSIFSDDPSTTPPAQPARVPSQPADVTDDLPTGIDPDSPEPELSPAPQVDPKTATSVAISRPAVSSNSAPTTAPVKKGIEGQLALGQQSLVLGDEKAAMTAFRNALDFDRKSLHAMHGIGLTHYQLGEKSKAIEQMEKSVKAGMNRALVHNVAVMHFSDNPMRAAKFIKDYLARPNVPLDEPLQNVLGSALNVAGATDAKNGVVFLQLREFYFQYDQQLAIAKKNGQKRWGMKWIQAEEADAKWQKSIAQVKEVDRLDKEVGRSKIRREKAEERLGDLNRSFGLVAERKYREANAEIKATRIEEAETRKRYEDAKRVLGNTEMPEFPRYFQIIPIDCLTPEQHPLQQ